MTIASLNAHLKTKVHESKGVDVLTHELENTQSPAVCGGGGI